MAPNGNIYFPSQDFLNDFSAAGVPFGLRATFIHEATHLYQWYGLGMWVWALGMRDPRSDDDLYSYELKKGKPLSGYGLEQMGEVVRDFYRLRHGRKIDKPYGLSAYADVLPVR